MAKRFTRKQTRKIKKKAPANISAAKPGLRQFAAKSKVTVSVATDLIYLVDEFVRNNADETNGVNRSSVVESALKLWRAQRVCEQEAEYYATAEEDLRKEDESWLSVSTESTKRTWP